MKEILSLETGSPSIVTSYASTFNASLEHTEAQAPHLIQLTKDGSESVSTKAGQDIPVLVTTRIASVGHLLAHAPMKSHFSTSLPIPSASTGAPSPHSTSMSKASTGQTFTHNPHAAQTLGIATVKLALLADIKSPGQASTQVLHPIHLAESKVNEVISFERLTGFFSEMKIAFQGQVWEHNPHLIQSSFTVIGLPTSSRVIAFTGQGSTQVPHPTQSLM